MEKGRPLRVSLSRIRGSPPVPVGVKGAAPSPFRQNGRWGLFEVHDKNMRKVHACEFVTLEYSSGAWFGETSKGNRWRIDPKFPSQNKKL